MKKEFNHSVRILVAEIERQGEKELRSVIGFTLTEESREIALLIYRLAMKTVYFKPDTQNYISSRNGSYRKFQKNDGCSRNQSTSISRIRYDLAKLSKFLGIDNCNKFFDGTITDYEEFKQKLGKRIKEYEHRALLGEFWIKPCINTGEIETVEILSESELQDIETLKKYGTWEGKRLLEGLMSERIVGHIKYLKNLE